MTKTTETPGITDIATVLRHLGVDVRRVGEKEISACCPVHANRTGREDGSPSWSMNASTGLWICYSCGARGSLSSLVSELTGESDSIIAVHTFLVSSGLERLNSEDVPEKRPVVDWKTFSAFPAPTDNRLITKNIDRESVKKYGIRFDRQDQAWILPIVSPIGELWGWQEKSRKYVYNYPVGVKKSETLFGIDKVDTNVGVLVESPLDVARLSTVVEGCSGLAAFGSSVSRQQVALLSEYVDKLIIALDNDEAGISAAKRLARYLPAFRQGIWWLRYDHTDAKDIGDMTDGEIVKAVSGASAFAWWLNV